MHLASRAQWERLLGGRCGGWLLDVGAGDGAVTQQLEPLFDHVETTELSTAMARLHARRGWRCHRRDVAAEGLPPGPWRAVALLNVLSIERRGRGACSAPSRLASPRMVRSSQPSRCPTTRWRTSGCTRSSPRANPIEAGDWELEATSFVERALEPLGFAVTAISRVPYLTGGDWHTPVGVLDDVLVVAERVGAS
jgi:hypothetical protein